MAVAVAPLPAQSTSLAADLAGISGRRRTKNYVMTSLMAAAVLVVGFVLILVLVTIGVKGWSIVSGAFPDWWLFVLGGLFVVVTLFLPKGIIGLIGQIRSGSVKRNSTSLDQQSAEAEAGIETKTTPEPAE